MKALNNKPGSLVSKHLIIKYARWEAFFTIWL